jgi:hypothetical protein
LRAARKAQREAAIAAATADGLRGDTVGEITVCLDIVDRRNGNSARVATASAKSMRRRKSESREGQGISNLEHLAFAEQALPKCQQHKNHHAEAYNFARRRRYVALY